MTDTEAYHVNNLLKRFGFAPVRFQIFSLGDCDGLLAAADESVFWSLFDRIIVAHVGGG